MSYLARLKAWKSQTPALAAPSIPSKAPFEGFEGDQERGVLEIVVPIGASDERAAARLASLAERPAPGVSPDAWRDRLNASASFAVAWGERASALGWRESDLYSLHPSAPMTRLDAMGAAFFTLGKTVTAVTAETVVLNVPPHGSIQRARRPTFSAAPAWETFL